VAGILPEVAREAMGCQLSTGLDGVVDPGRDVEGDRNRCDDGTLREYQGQDVEDRRRGRHYRAEGMPGNVGDVLDAAQEPTAHGVVARRRRWRGLDGLFERLLRYARGRRLAIAGDDRATLVDVVIGAAVHRRHDGVVAGLGRAVHRRVQLRLLLLRDLFRGV